MIVVKPLEKYEARLTGQGLEAGKSYLVRKVILKPVPLGLISSATVQDDEGYLYSVNSAHIMFDLKSLTELV